MSFRDQVRGALTAAQQIAGESATYSRGAQSVALSVLPGQAGFTADPTRGLAVKSDQQDWLIRADQLVLGGSVTFPQEKDRITVQRDGKTLLYEAFPPQDFEQCYRADPTGSLIRVHTKLRSRT